MLTENGRQPWIVQGLMKTIDASSPSVTSTEIWISLAAFVLSYIVLAWADLVLMLRYSRRGLARADEEAGEPAGPDGRPPAVPALTY
jgi:cytochrome bd ubiquinol oxidase subunit I